MANKVLQLKGEIHQIREHQNNNAKKRRRIQSASARKLRRDKNQARESLQNRLQDMDDRTKNIYDKRSAGQKRRWDTECARSSQEESEDLLQNAENQDKKEAATAGTTPGRSKIRPCDVARTARREAEPLSQNAENQEKQEAEPVSGRSARGLSDTAAQGGDTRRSQNASQAPLLPERRKQCVDDAGTSSAPPPGEQFRRSLQSLQDMGFTDRAATIRALSASTGSVDRAIESLLDGHPGAVAEFTDFVDT